MIIQILKIMFNWPQGIVVGNLIASFITWVFGIIVLDIRNARRHKEHMSLLKEIHGKRETS